MVAFADTALETLETAADKSDLIHLNLIIENLSV
jgi:hypothetical protein